MGQRGFSLIELLVSMAIMGILITVAALNFGSYQRKSRLDRQVKELYADLQDARMKAAFTKRRQSVDFTANQAVFRSYADDADTTGSLLSTKQLSLAMTTNVSSPSNRVVFDTKGIMTYPTAIKVLCVTTSEDAALDALIITPVTTNMGKVRDRGAACAISNVIQK